MCDLNKTEPEVTVHTREYGNQQLKRIADAVGRIAEMAKKTHEQNQEMLAKKTTEETVAPDNEKVFPADVREKTPEQD